MVIVHYGPGCTCPAQHDRYVMIVIMQYERVGSRRT